MSTSDGRERAEHGLDRRRCAVFMSKELKAAVEEFARKSNQSFSKFVQETMALRVRRPDLVPK